jgi:hypothetical protein
VRVKTTSLKLKVACRTLRKEWSELGIQHPQVEHYLNLLEELDHLEDEKNAMRGDYIASNFLLHSLELDSPKAEKAKEVLISMIMTTGTRQ